MALSYKLFWDDLLARNTGIGHGCYRIAQASSIPATPGLYAWHINLNSVNTHAYHKAFKQRRLVVEAKSDLQDHFAGNIDHVSKEATIVSPSMDIALCELASHIFCPPVYIGISKDLNRRLGEHIKELELIYGGSKQLPPPSQLGKSDFDTIKESRYFAERLGFTIIKQGGINLTSLFIKTIELPTGYNWSDLHAVETYINRTFVPHYGRR